MGKICIHILKLQTELLQKRQRAIQRKYTEYAESQDFRERYNQRVLGFKSKMEMHSPV